jgi:hypothetical protein
LSRPCSICRPECFSSWLKAATVTAFKRLRWSPYGGHFPRENLRLVLSLLNFAQENLRGGFAAPQFFTGKSSAGTIQYMPQCALNIAPPICSPNALPGSVLLPQCPVSPRLGRSRRAWAGFAAPGPVSPRLGRSPRAWAGLRAPGPVSARSWRRMIGRSLLKFVEGKMLQTCLARVVITCLISRQQPLTH